MMSTVPPPTLKIPPALPKRELLLLRVLFVTVSATPTLKIPPPRQQVGARPVDRHIVNDVGQRAAEIDRAGDAARVNCVSAKIGVGRINSLAQRAVGGGIAKAIVCVSQRVDGVRHRRSCMR